MLTIVIKVTYGISLIPLAKKGVKEGSRSKGKMRIFSTQNLRINSLMLTMIFNSGEK